MYSHSPHIILQEGRGGSVNFTRKKKIVSEAGRILDDQLQSQF